MTTNPSDEFRSRLANARKSQNDRALALLNAAGKQTDHVMLNEIEHLRKEIREIRAELRSELHRLGRKINLVSDVVE